MSAKETTKSVTTPTDSNSAPVAEAETPKLKPPWFRACEFELVLHEAYSNKIKCGPCEEATSHCILPVGLFPTPPIVDPLEVIQMTRRVLLCEQCGNIRLVK